MASLRPRAGRVLGTAFTKAPNSLGGRKSEDLTDVRQTYRLLKVEIMTDGSGVSGTRGRWLRQRGEQFAGGCRTRCRSPHAHIADSPSLYHCHRISPAQSLQYSEHSTISFRTPGSAAPRPRSAGPSILRQLISHSRRSPEITHSRIASNPFVSAWHPHQSPPARHALRTIAYGLKRHREKL
ncbi:hypothetical protein BU23DRAFT_22644 [Bimuria novae-zelandiae CBS 107.79]|uniref:Uncharacterized protein n=1 Tax=Bimuria novae-zelandiae CBS 107.79 TaxID=1447943 RepID=A0A6A5UL01_9PLEO|nr:hypothetical protein BU23DRAFT_22644 [Bimuria novae-zelandiae CBS 107.79]